jgi:uncharacterized protein
MRHDAKLHRATLTASLLLVAMAGPAVAGPLEDGEAAYQREDYATAYRLLRPLADQGNAEAQDMLGTMYVVGEGVPKNYSEAVKWYRRAADQGNADAQSHLGLMYHNGLGVPQDYVRAHKWLNLSAARGNNFAIKYRDNIAERMTPAQIAEAQKLAREWKPKPER